MTKLMDIKWGKEERAQSARSSFPFPNKTQLCHFDQREKSNEKMLWNDQKKWDEIV